jgi:hypothetical protein
LSRASAADGDIIIRHVCQCGKPVNHQSICRPPRGPAGLEPDDVERVPVEFEEFTTERARGRYERRKREFGAERRARRAGMDAFALHRWIVEQTARMSTVKASNTGKSAPSSENTQVGPDRQQELDDDPRWREHERIVKSHLRGMAALVDEQLGHETVAETSKMGAEEKDRVILDPKHEGLRAQTVFDLIGDTGITGNSPETIRRKRRDAGLDYLGRPRAPHADS